jgi:hypothetical protein
MQFLILSTILGVMVVDHLASYAMLVPRVLAYAPNILSVVAFLYVIFAGAAQRFRYVRAAYWLTFGSMIVVMTLGVVLNRTAPGPIFAGIRLYFQAIPFFFIPAVYAFSDKQIRTQMRLLLLIAALQVPTACLQRLSLMEQQRFTGDPVVGTTVDSSVLSIYLICVVCILTGAFLQKQISRLWFFVFFIVLLIPTTINETKATLILLPFGLLMSVVIGSPPERRGRIIVISTALLITFLAGFAAVYDYIQRSNNPNYVSLEDFFFGGKAQLQHYVHQDNADIGGKHPGRVDAIMVPLKYLARDPVTLAFGLGVGSDTHSSLGETFTGDYYVIFQKLTQSSFTVFLLELGLLGTVLVFVLHWQVFQDCRVVATHDTGRMRYIAVGMAGIVTLMTVSTFYKMTYVFTPLAYLFWYFAGLIAAHRIRLAYGEIAEPAALAELETATPATIRYSRTH